MSDMDYKEGRGDYYLAEGRRAGRDEAIWNALLFILAWSNDEVRKLRPLAADSFLRALEQDGYTVVAK